MKNLKKKNLNRFNMKKSMILIIKKKSLTLKIFKEIFEIKLK